MSERIWMNKAQLADYLKVNPSTIYRHVKAGKLPEPHRLSYGVARYYRPEIDAFLLAR